MASSDNVVDRVIGYWLNGVRDGEPLPQSCFKLWFIDKPDQYIRDNFGQDVKDASEGRLDHLKNTPLGTLTLLVLLDQFPRNMFRGTPEAFAYDHLAQQLALYATDPQNRIDLQLHPVQRMFVYLPFEHAEDRALQVKSLQLFQENLDSTPEMYKQLCVNMLKYARDHHDIIERFGRFPHRNVILGRETTPEEQEFLKIHSGF
eukprot:TRINITY_DN607_c0_g1_i5.p1 TRINITY_DN607_c0_g1~~TRINITY_DN607_c0_g1_i5.p1  ORF type:complete len:203 (+),score=45.59 TRINITY_DN607_c0_g1_i5:79-687(+)